MLVLRQLRVQETFLAQPGRDLTQWQMVQAGAGELCLTRYLAYHLMLISGQTAALATLAPADLMIREH